jgi:hypothetical protein
MSVAEILAPETGTANGAGFDPSVLLGAISGGATDPLSLIMSQIGAQAPDSPVVAVLSRLLEQRRASPPAEAQSEAREEEAAREQQEREQQERERSLQALRDTVEKAYAELEALRARNDALAAGLGACYLCFGTDPQCPVCSGRGLPGSRPPEPAAYRKYVLPAMQRVRAIQAGAQHRPPRNPPPLAGAAPAGMHPQRGETRSWRPAENTPPIARPATAEGEGGVAP